MNKGNLTKRKTVFTFTNSCGNMYLVEIGVFAKNSTKSMDNMRINAVFPECSFVVFYQPFFLHKPLLV